MKNCKYPIARNFFKTETKCFLNLCKKHNLEVLNLKETKRRNLSRSIHYTISLSGIPIFLCSIRIEQRFFTRFTDSQYIGKRVTIIFDNPRSNYCKIIRWKQYTYKMENGKCTTISNKKPKFRVIFNKIIKRFLFIFNQQNIQTIMES